MPLACVRRKTREGQGGTKKSQKERRFLRSERRYVWSRQSDDREKNGWDPSGNNRKTAGVKLSTWFLSGQVNLPLGPSSGDGA